MLTDDLDCFEILSFYQLFNKVIEIEDNSLITIACRKCNKDLEEK